MPRRGHELPGAVFGRNQTEKDFTAAPRAACAETAKDAEKKSFFSSAVSAVFGELSRTVSAVKFPEEFKELKR
jgi:hypothetical protein